MLRYADSTSRAGVLEPEGIVEIKFRKERMLAMMDRLDPTYRDLKAQAAAEGTSEQSAALKDALVAREKSLWATYSQMAVHFADLHDTPVRMKAKGTIREVLDWSQSRRYFYWRLLLRLKETEVVERMMKADKSLTRPEALSRLADIQQSEPASDREAVEKWAGLEPAIKAELQKLETKQAATSLADMAHLSNVGLGSHLNGLSAEEAAVC